MSGRREASPLFTRRQLLLSGAMLAASPWLARPSMTFAAEAAGGAGEANRGAATDTSAARPPGDGVEEGLR